MKAMILAAGLGTRLRPWTLEHPKALVPVKGVPMLERVIRKLAAEGFTDIVVNVHHFAEQIEDFLGEHDFGVNISVSDERQELLDTGGALSHARALLCADNEPVLVHNVDILSNAPLAEFMERHKQSGAMASMLVSGRDSSRKLVFGPDNELRGWHNLNNEERKPAMFVAHDDDKELAFSGIHIINPELIREMPEGKFSIIDYYLSKIEQGVIKMINMPSLKLIDIGKPHTLAQAEDF